MTTLGDAVRFGFGFSLGASAFAIGSALLVRTVFGLSKSSQATTTCPVCDRVLLLGEARPGDRVYCECGSRLKVA
jgi:hypothetical protein